MSAGVKDKAKRVQSRGNILVVQESEWSHPVVSAGNQSDRLRALLEAGAITPDEYARLVGEVMESVDRKITPTDDAGAKKVACSRCGKWFVFPLFGGLF